MSWKSVLRERHQQRQQQNLWRSRVTASSPQSRIIMVEGRELLNFCSNDYLGLANHGALKEAGIAAVEKWGSGSGASHLICGHCELHERLETTVADFVGAEQALVFSTGYMANLAVPQTFLDRHGLLVEDKLNHASLLDAGQLCTAKMQRYPHLDSAAAERLLQESDAPRKMLLTDGIFSMDGDVAPVVQLTEICQRHDALLVVDDAHGFGVLGDTGAGCLQQKNIAIGDHVIMIGTFGKSAGSFGAFVAGDAEIVESLIQFARPYIYTTALPPVVAATTIAAIELIRREPLRREQLHHNVAYFRRVAQTAGLRLGDSMTPIQPVFIDSENAKPDMNSNSDSDRTTVSYPNQVAILEAGKILRLSENLMNQGIWVAAIRPPTVPVGSARLRVTLTAEHTTEDIDRLVSQLRSLLDEILT